MEAHDGQPATGTERALGRFQPVHELPEFVVHRDAQRLEGARRRVALPRLGARQHAFDDHHIVWSRRA